MLHSVAAAGENVHIVLWVSLSLLSRRIRICTQMTFLWLINHNKEKDSKVVQSRTF